MALPPAPPPLAPANAALAWLLGPWECDATVRPELPAAEVRAHGRLIVDAYMDVWIGAGFEAETPSVPKGDMYLGFDPAAGSWSLLGFRSDGSHYVLSSPGEVGGRIDWSGTSSAAGKTRELKATWTHKGGTLLQIQMDRRAGVEAGTFQLTCTRPPAG